jgi:DNA-binding LacI/PurR family transcriptional regulator
MTMSTIYEVAHLAGVSPKTAARILAGESPKSKNRAFVLKCAGQLGYVRNQQAANLRIGKSGLVGILVPYIDNPFYTKFLQEMHNALRTHNSQCLIACSFGKSENMLAALHHFEAYNIDGLVVDVNEGSLSPQTQEILQHMQRRGRPVIITGAQLPNKYYDHFYLDNINAMDKVVRHLSSRGHKLIGFVGGIESNPNIHSRLDGLKKAIKSLKLTTKDEWIGLGDSSAAAVQQRAFQILRLPKRPTAIACTSDMIAIAVMKAAHELNLQVPRDIAVVGFDDIDIASLSNPGLTTVKQPMQVMAQDIGILLAEKQRKAKESKLFVRHYEPELIIREST